MSQVSEVLCQIVRYKLNFLEIPQNCDFLGSCFFPLDPFFFLDDKTILATYRERPT